MRLANVPAHCVVSYGGKYMTEGGYEVDPERLDAVGRGVDEVAEIVRSACGSREGRFGPSAARADGWRTAAASRTTAEAWTRFAVELATSLTDLSDDMRTAARDYRDAEERSRAQFSGGRIPE
jgi:hypothetical protein